MPDSTNLLSAAEQMRIRLPQDLREFGYPLCDRAADEIERLREQVARLESSNAR